MRKLGVTNSTSANPTSLTQQKAQSRNFTYPNKLGVKSDAYVTQGRCLRTPHQLQENVQKEYPNEASQQEDSNATTLTLVGVFYRRQSKKIRSCKRSHSTLQQRSLLTQTTSQRITVATGHVSRYSLLNTNQHLLATLQQISHTADANATHSTLSTAQRQQILLRMLNTTTTADITTSERQHSAMTRANC
ncbi:hypothetical protein F511_01178 [Dorcoceras hygrometricum]|uniref:Uncharacterized protein n=1 Tax=Dorcoceras hygrometricum TaxID=472368 RepID=A0A2Z7BWG0_9LAMI|nr:hypothetical protein F511_01178 [Dorcoceras hygrometricum]